MTRSAYFSKQLVRYDNRIVVGLSGAKMNLLVISIMSLLAGAATGVAWL